MPAELLTERDAARKQQLENAPAVVSVAGLSKSFRLPEHQYSTLKERVIHPFRTQSYNELHALKQVDFEVRQGEFFGIVGRNGSGKSTMLKCLAGIYDSDSGQIAVNGRLSPFIELGVGFNPDLTARDNVIINAIMLGLTRKQARERFDDIVAFAELEQFLDMKLKNYSSGMNVRLAFSVAIQVSADVLLIDEVLAVGDASFQQKCFEQFQLMKEEGKTILFVTHDMGQVERFCDRAMLIEKGELVDIGKPAQIARKYNELNFGHLVHKTAGWEEQDLSRDAQIVDAWFENHLGERVKALAQGERCRMCMKVKFHRQIKDPIFGVTVRNNVRHTIFATTTAWAHPDTGTFEPGETAVAVVQMDTWLAPSRYSLTPSVAHAGAGSDLIDFQDDLVSLVVHGMRDSGGVIDPPHQFEIQKVADDQ